MTELVTYRDMDASDVAASHALAGELRWAHRLEDLQLFKEAGFGCIASDGRGATLGSGMWFPYGDGLATIGMVIVAPASQGKGVGRELMRKLMEAAGARAIRLIATKAGRPLYDSLGFRIVGTVTQHQGTATPVHGRHNPEVRVAANGDWPSIAALDTGATGGDRTTLLQALRKVSEILVLERDGEVRGFSMCRRFGLGHVVGPVVCTDDADAVDLVSLHVSGLAGRFVRVDTHRTEGMFSDFLLGSGLAIGSRSPQMVLGAGGIPGSVHTFALASQALG